PISTRPSVGGRMPARVRRVVVFPAPFGPTSPRISPGDTSNERSFTARKPSYFFRSRSTRIIAGHSTGRASHPSSLAIIARMLDRILVLGPSWLGDAVMAIPTYRALREVFPRAHLAVLARGPVEDLYRMVDVVDEVVPYRRPRGLKRLFAYVDLVRRLQRVRADAAILLPRSFGAAWTALLADVPRRVG